jgi:hypothetical protein
VKPVQPNTKTAEPTHGAITEKRLQIALDVVATGARNAWCNLRSIREKAEEEGMDQDDGSHGNDEEELGPGDPRVLGGLAPRHRDLAAEEPVGLERAAVQHATKGKQLAHGHQMRSGRSNGRAHTTSARGEGVSEGGYHGGGARRGRAAATRERRREGPAEGGEDERGPGAAEHEEGRVGRRLALLLHGVGPGGRTREARGGQSASRSSREVRACPLVVRRNGLGEDGGGAASFIGR